MQPTAQQVPVIPSQQPTMGVPIQSAQMQPLQPTQFQPLQSAQTQPLQPTQFQPLQSAQMQPLQVQYNPTQNPQIQMVQYRVAPNQMQVGMQYPPQGVGPGYMPQQPLVTDQPRPSIATTTDETINGTQMKLPKYALTISASMFVIFTALLCWIPGNICLLPALIVAIVVSGIANRM